MKPIRKDKAQINQVNDLVKKNITTEINEENPQSIAKAQ